MSWPPPPSSPQGQPLASYLFGRGQSFMFLLKNFFLLLPASAKVRQQVGCTQIIFSSSMQRARFESFSAVRHQARSGWRELWLRDCEVVSVPCMYHRDFHCPLLSQHLSLWPFLILRILMVVSLM